MNEALSTWLNGQHLWVQEAASRLLSKGAVDDADIAAFVVMIKTPIVNSNGTKPSPRTYPEFGVGSTGAGALRLTSIGDIVGIDKLAPRQPLAFAAGNLTVIYGNNGSGKSGYARILKKACGKAESPDLKSNVFAAEPPDRRCTISFEVDGVAVAKQWAANSASIPELHAVDIYDATSGRLYLDSETGASFIPPELALLADLVDVCQRVEAALSAELEAHPKALPILPPAHQGSKAGQLYNGLRAETKSYELATLFPWTAEDEADLSELNAKKAVTNPATEAQKRRAAKGQIDGLRSRLVTARDSVTLAKCDEIIALTTASVAARKVATEGTVALTQSALLPGVGSQTWKALWEAARAYSSEIAYQEDPFPNTQNGAKCVLCQQDLDVAAKRRLADFEGYVSGELETMAKDCEAAARKRLEELPEIPNDDVLATSCQAAGLTPEVTEQLKSAWDDILATVNLLKVVPLKEKPTGIDVIDCPLLAELSALSQSNETQALKFDEDAKALDPSKTATAIQELEAKKWTSAQKDAILAEISRLKAVAKIIEWKKLTGTKGLSRKAGELSEALITDAYVARFNMELKKLGASRVQVELVKSKVVLGQVKHRIQLKGVDSHKAGDILSEGELRIVSLAAFLATVLSRTDNAPFIFDDPISSLDQDYEEKVIDRLVELSADRQVVVLTHRLSFLSIIEKAKPHVITIRQEVWGTGEPGDVPMFAKKPVSALNNLLNTRVPEARKALEAQGQMAYYPLAKAICSDTRILLERIVELIFLADVVQRHRRAVQTENKIKHLAKITLADCVKVDKFMTSYSTFEHSQSAEAPVDVPAPEALETDLKELIEWIDEFSKRPAP